MSVENDIKYWLWLLLSLGAGSRVSVRLVRAAGSAKAVWDDLSGELEAEAKVKPAVMNKLRYGRDLTEAEDIIARCEAKNIRILTPDMPEYPKSLLCLMDFPMVLFCMGKLPDFNSRFCGAVVGTRHMSDYGKRMAYDIGWGLADGGAVVVSGLALGVDGMAMAGAQAAGGATVGVLGCGIDIIYPQEHKELFRRTLKSGAVISEYPPGIPPKGGNFPVRNRIISGLCQAVAIVEADMKSGALITAKHALYQGRHVFAVPGNAHEKNSEGCIMLLSGGASVVTSANDILSHFEFLYPHSLKPARNAPNSGADKVAAAVRVASSDDPKSKYQGGGVYGGIKRGRAVRAKKTEEHIDEARQMAEAEAKEKISRLDFTHVDLLGEKELAIYREMPPNTPMIIDEFAAKGYDVKEVTAALTLLELTGAVEAGAGGYFIRTTEDDDLFARSFEE